MQGNTDVMHTEAKAGNPVITAVSE